MQLQNENNFNSFDTIEINLVFEVFELNGNLSG